MLMYKALTVFLNCTALMSIPVISSVAATSPLIQFGITEYEDNTYYHLNDNEDIKKSDLPSLEFETLQVGNGNISYIGIDGTQLSTSAYDYEKYIYATNKAVTWKSSNTAVATVDATGKVT